MIATFRRGRTSPTAPGGSGLKGLRQWRCGLPCAAPPRKIGAVAPAHSASSAAPGQWRPVPCRDRVCGRRRTADLHQDRTQNGQRLRCPAAAPMSRPTATGAGHESRASPGSGAPARRRRAWRLRHAPRHLAGIDQTVGAGHGIGPRGGGDVLDDQPAIECSLGDRCVRQYLLNCADQAG